ncbi:TRAP transporter permease [Vibrio sp. MA40-2]|uniref:TRAP transporter permease n=1 Tax=Vibrio sp. MA40-2 TaxID=3391828 RepID=UPI0039A75F56
MIKEVASSSTDSQNQDIEPGSTSEINLLGLSRRIAEIIAVIMAVFYLGSAAFGGQALQYHLGVYVGITLILIFLIYPIKIGEKKLNPTLLDYSLVVLSASSTLYFVLNYGAIIDRLGAETTTDLAFSAIMLVLSIEAGRRVLGWTMPIIGAVFLLYAIFGRYMPDLISHRGFSLERISLFFYLSEDGVFGLMARVLVDYVILFVFLGAFLGKSGVGGFFIDIALSLAGRMSGGPAKVAVVASAMMGSISGSAIANTVSTGSLTIPLMKKVGFSRESSGAIEASASIGGMFLPPVMGAGVFIMVELTGVPYQTLVMVSIVPALLYFASVWSVVHYEAKSLGLGGLTDDDVPKFKDVIRERWFLSIPLIIMVTLLVSGFTPGYSAFWGILATIPCSWFNPRTRMNLKSVFEALSEGGLNTLIIGANVGVISLILGMISLTGLAQEFTNIMLQASNDSVLIAIALIAIASLIVGMGLPVTASYIVVAVLAVPTLSEMGVALISAHMIVYWLSQDSNITPPVCVAAYAGAAIAKADPWKTGWKAVGYAKMLYIMPLLFAFTPMLMNGEPIDIAITWISTAIGVVFQGALMAGFFRTKTTKLERFLLLATTVLCFWPGLETLIMGVGLGGIVYYMQGMNREVVEVQG